MFGIRKFCILYIWNILLPKLCNRPGMDLLGGFGGCTPPSALARGGEGVGGGVPFFIIKKKKGQIIDGNLSNTADTS